MAINELLDSARRRQVRLCQVFEQLEVTAKLGVQCVWRVTHNRQTAALRRAIRPKRRYNDVPIGSHRASNLLHIGSSRFGVGQEVEDRSVVPNVERMLGELGIDDIADEPLHASSLMTQSTACHVKGRCRYIQH